MKSINWLSALLLLQFHFVYSKREEFVENLKRIRAAEGTTPDHLMYDTEIEDILRDIDLASISDAEKWSSTSAEYYPYRLIRGKSDLRKCDLGQPAEKDFLKRFDVTMLDKNDSYNFLYDPLFYKVAVNFIDEVNENIPFVIGFEAQEIPNFVVTCIRHLRGIREDMLESDPNQNLNSLNLDKLKTIQDVQVVNRKFDHKTTDSLGIQIIKLLNALVKENGPDKLILFHRNAKRMGVHIEQTDPPSLVIKIELTSIDACELGKKLWDDLMNITKNCIEAKVTQGFALSAKEEGFKKIETTEMLNALAIRIAAGYGTTDESHDLIPHDLIRSRQYDKTRFIGIFKRKLYEPNNQTGVLLEAMADIRTDREEEGKNYRTPLALFNPKNICGGIGFALVKDKNEKQYLNVFLIFEHN